jgi:hypothetical protein
VCTSLQLSDITLNCVSMSVLQWQLLRHSEKLTAGLKVAFS